MSDKIREAMCAVAQLADSDGNVQVRAGDLADRMTLSPVRARYLLDAMRDHDLMAYGDQTGDVYCLTDEGRAFIVENDLDELGE